MRQITALIIGLAFIVVLAAQAFTLAALLNGRVLAENVAMIAWADAVLVMMILLGIGIIATVFLMLAMFRRRRRHTGG